MLDPHREIHSINASEPYQEVSDEDNAPLIASSGRKDPLGIYIENDE